MFFINISFFLVREVLLVIVDNLDNNKKWKREKKPNYYYTFLKEDNFGIVLMFLLCLYFMELKYFAQLATCEHSCFCITFHFIF